MVIKTDHDNNGDNKKHFSEAGGSPHRPGAHSLLNHSNLGAFSDTVSNEQHVEDAARALAIGSESYSRRPSSSSWWTFRSLVATVAVATQVQGSNTAESCGICGVVGTQDHDARYVNIRHEISTDKLSEIAKELIFTRLT